MNGTTRRAGESVGARRARSRRTVPAAACAWSERRTSPAITSSAEERRERPPGTMTWLDRRRGLRPALSRTARRSAAAPMTNSGCLQVGAASRAGRARRRPSGLAGSCVVAGTGGSWNCSFVGSGGCAHEEIRVLHRRLDDAGVGPGRSTDRVHGARPCPPGAEGSRRWPPSRSRPGPRPCATSSGTVPSKHTVPPSRTITRSHSAATSSVWCVASSTPLVRACSDSSPRSDARCSGSRPVVGSSRMTRVGSPIRACAMASRRRCPPERAETRLPPRLVELHEPEHPQHLAVPRRGVGPLLEDGHVVEEVERRGAAREADLLRQVAEPPPRLGTGGDRRR